VDRRRRTLGAEEPATIKTLTRLGRTAYLQRAYPQAEALFTQDLEIQRRRRRFEDPDTVATVNNLAGVYLERGKQGEAAAANNEVMEIRRRTLGPEHPETLATVNSLALIETAQGKYEQAAALFSQGLVHYVRSEALARDALELTRKTQPDDWSRFRAERRKVAMGVPNLYNLDRAGEWIVSSYRASGNRDKAEEWRQRHSPLN